ncbi:hypothetical protein PSI9734_00831 [Pseudidiomarina piscicola]|uniref:2-amino-4-hydroxy-6-hydroxymethyldihydropteridine pyrophosphokinase n=1 Tax=Pseudidiomarina piscicola TaxID=2614830 RepID=A0A6S6WMU6_9GAMM|nr:2-amino-4-hydroxy-6-hydroxymethyldihydropteridine diphosphokinase [Pseudidiomarina piscicola]CAB0150277.1 hypothetical protein PSI9734_00831 [Pseudidiomarina piscicola]VZT39706.1 hypothetical protein PSI9734_00831 [Pseudomonas aeruginosa]
MVYVYLCSMGANIAPEKNFARAKLLLSDLGQVNYSPAEYTRPVAINTEHDFLNALFLIQTELSQQQLKQHFNAIEETLGRDRSDPLCSEKDRPMDIDILGTLSNDEAQAVWLEVPDYLQKMSTSLKPIANQLELTP